MSRVVAAFVSVVLVSAVGVLAGCSSAGADVSDGPTAGPPPCEFADAESLAFLVAGGDVAEQIAQPFVFDRVDCAGGSATAYTMPDGVNPSVAVRFAYSIGAWRPVGVGHVPTAITTEEN